ncbi:hypothetical protein SUDANB1_05586 [Streptomyces sp. enrichment culture]|uniref:hypothetical protein n=1 Tax=Streptomyces sp. enrichment culture TaxID=1795815 RepID=UPI003F574419
MWLLELLIDLAEFVDRAVRMVAAWWPLAVVSGLLGVALGWRASGRFRRCPDASADDVRTLPDVDEDTVTVRAPTCADTCPDWCGRTCPDASWRTEQAKEQHST